MNKFSSRGHVKVPYASINEFDRIGYTAVGKSLNAADYGTPQARERCFFVAVRNDILHQTTALALSLGTVFTGSVLVEVIFRYPGLGNTLYQAIKLNDFFVIRGMIFIVIVTLGLATFIIDVTYPLLDPRVSYKKGG